MANYKKIQLNVEICHSVFCAQLKIKELFRFILTILFKRILSYRHTSSLTFYRIKI